MGYLYEFGSFDLRTHCRAAYIQRIRACKDRLINAARDYGTD